MFSPPATLSSSQWDQTRRFAGDLVADRWEAIRLCASLCVSSDWFPAHTASPWAPWRRRPHPEISVFPVLGLFSSFPAASFCRSPHAGETLSPRTVCGNDLCDGTGARSLTLAKQGQQAFVYASAPLVTKSSLKTRQKEAAEEPDNPPPLSSLTCHDSPRLAGSVSTSRAARTRSLARVTASSGAARLPFVCLIIQITTWGEIRAGTGNTDYVLSCSRSSISLQVVNVPCRIHLGCSSQRPDRLAVTLLGHSWGWLQAPQHLMQGWKLPPALSTLHIAPLQWPAPLQQPLEPGSMVLVWLSSGMLH